MKSIYTIAVVLSCAGLAAAGPRRAAKPELLRANFGHLLAPEAALDIEGVRELASKDDPEALILTAALDPAFLEANRAPLEAWLGTPEALEQVESKARSVSADPTILSEIRFSGNPARASQALRFALESSGRSLDGAIGASPSVDAGVEIAELRRDFNARYTPQAYRDLHERLKQDSGIDAPFTISHTPIFLPQSLLEKMIGASRDIMRQLTTPEYIAASHRAIPPEFNVRNEAPHPMFVQMDYGMARNPSTGEMEPKLVELQGFPSLYAFSASAGRAYKAAYGLDDDLRYLLGGNDDASFRELMRKAIVGDHDPKHVVLMEIDPWRQSTRNDFLLTEKMLGIKTVAVDAIEKRGKKLFYRDEAGKLVRIERIYNRVIPDELVRRPDVRPKFKLTDKLDVEWAGHPNWFLRMSKFSLPFINHEASPKSMFLDQVDPAAMPDSEIAKYVLKPWYSFGGKGVNIHPTRADLLAIPPAERSRYILQERVDFQPFVETPFGLTKAEIRIMFIWLDGMSPIPVTTVTRLTRGLITGVGHNRGIPWAGSSLTVYRP